MTDLLNKAKEIAEQAHAGQTDKAGRPYIEHLAFVSSLMETNEEKIVAWLHDVLEDCDVGADTLAAIFPPNIMEALEALTHKDGESYDGYIERVRTNPLAVMVKLVDLAHNMDLTRLPNLTEDDSRRVEKYKTAREYLSRSLREENYNYPAL